MNIKIYPNYNARTSDSYKSGDPTELRVFPTATEDFSKSQIILLIEICGSYSGTQYHAANQDLITKLNNYGIHNTGLITQEDKRGVRYIEVNKNDFNRERLFTTMSKLWF
jgi:hypothetical protein